MKQVIVTDPQRVDWRISRKIVWDSSDVPTKPFQVDIVEGQLGTKLMVLFLILCWLILLWFMPEPRWQFNTLFVGISLMSVLFTIVFRVFSQFLQAYAPIIYIIGILFSIITGPTGVIHLLVWFAPLLTLFIWYISRYRRITLETINKGIEAEKWEGYFKGAITGLRQMRQVIDDMEFNGTPKNFRYKRL